MADKKEKQVKKEINAADYPDYGDYMAAKRALETGKSEEPEGEGVKE